MGTLSNHFSQLETYNKHMLTYKITWKSLKLNKNHILKSQNLEVKEFGNGEEFLFPSL